MADENLPDDRGPVALGLYLKSVRKDLKMTLRDVEEASGKEVSNAYLSQMETGKITKPSPHILHALSVVLRISYEDLMARAGYITSTPQHTVTSQDESVKHGRAATFASLNLTGEEEDALLNFLNNYLRKK